jgi:defect-in-organelle-trafficking protein DotB
MNDASWMEPYDFRGDFGPVNFKRFLKYCADRHVSDILVQGGDYIWAEIHGRQRRASVHTVQQGRLSSLISSVWQADIESGVRAGKGVDRSLEISGEEFGIERGRSLRFRCNFIQGRIARLDEAYAITMRVIPSALPDLDALAVEGELRDALYPSAGLALICGPTGSGKTTLQAAIYAHAGRHMPDRKVITYEDPIEYVLGGAHWKGPQPAQSQIGRDVESFAAGLRNAMRRKPSIIGIGEARDLPTVDAMIEAGLTGHLCYATVHAESVAETINRIIQSYPPDRQPVVAARLLGTLRLVVVQRLLRTANGSRIALREHMVFDNALRRSLYDIPCERWSPTLQDRLEREGATLEDKAWTLCRSGAIDKEEFVELAGLKAWQARQTPARAA